MKKVAVIMESWMRCFTYAWPSGMLSKIKEVDADVNLYIFNSSGNWSSDEAYNEGEYNIFRLPNLSDYDGVVLDLNNILKQEMREQVLQKVKESGVPAIVIGNEVEGFYSVGIDNYGAMRNMIAHLYEHHESRSFWFLMGPDDNYENIRRTKALTDYMEEKGIPKENYAFHFGSFEHECGVEGFHQLKQHNEKVPDAIICANDNIAVGALTAAEEYGLKAPDDFLITGFDDLDKSRYYNPRISTISHIREDIGYACMELFFDIWNGKQPEKFFHTKTTPIFWDSCGCTSDIVTDVRQHLKDHILYNVETSAFEDHVQALKNQMLYCNTVQEMLDCIPQCIPSLKCDAMYLVMDKHLKEMQEVVGRITPDTATQLEEDSFLTEGYPEEMEIAFSYENDLVGTDGEHQTITGIFPIFDCEEKGTNFLFVPMHFRDKCIGYFVIRNAIYLMEKQFLFEIINALTNGLEHLYERGRLARMNHVLSVLYNHDAMTMLYNRMGLNEFAGRYMRKKHRAGEPVCVMYIDLDRLKYINDTFGHEQGDFAIKTVAETALKYSSENGLVFRLGGDEFLVVDDFIDRQTADLCYKQMQDELWEIGKKNNCPFEMSISFGYVVTDPAANTGLDEYIRQADDIMYQHKVERKMNRRD